VSTKKTVLVINHRR